jgi:ABC-type sugar transport system substrate-binding protein
MLAASCRGVSRRTVFAGLVALSASGLPARAQTKPRRFAVAIPNTKRLYYKRMLTGMSGAAASLGIELHVEEYAYDVKKELLVVEALSQQGFDGYIVVSVGTEGAEAELAGILQKIPAPFATVGYRILGAAVTVLPDWRSAGTLQAQLATKFAPAGSTLLYLTVQTDYGAEASEAFQVAVKQNQSAALVLTINSFSREEAIDSIFKALAADPRVAVIAASTDQLGLWAAEAAANAKRQVKVIGLGASEEGLAAIGAGGLAGTIDLKPDAQGSAAVKGLAPVAEKHLCDNGQKPPRPEELIQPRTITSAALPLE